MSKKVRVRKPVERKVVNTSEKFIGNIDWYYNHSTQDEYGFVKHTELGGVYFRGDVVIGINPERLRENEQVIFELRSSDLNSKRKRATKLYKVEEEKDILYQNLATKISKNGLLRMNAQTKRSQVWNKRIVIQKFIDTVQHALKPQKQRIPTKKPKAINEKRLKNKRVKSEIKQMRKKITL